MWRPASTLIPANGRWATASQLLLRLIQLFTFHSFNLRQISCTILKRWERITSSLLVSSPGVNTNLPTKKYPNCKKANSTKEYESHQACWLFRYHHLPTRSPNTVLGVRWKVLPPTTYQSIGISGAQKKVTQIFSLKQATSSGRLVASPSITTYPISQSCVRWKLLPPNYHLPQDREVWCFNNYKRTQKVPKCRHERKVSKVPKKYL